MQSIELFYSIKLPCLGLWPLDCVINSVEYKRKWRAYNMYLPLSSLGFSGVPHKSTEAPSITSSRQADEPPDFLELIWYIGVRLLTPHEPSPCCSSYYGWNMQYWGWAMTGSCYHRLTTLFLGRVVGLWLLLESVNQETISFGAAFTCAVQ